MNIYDKFAAIYETKRYLKFSEQMAIKALKLIKGYNSPRSILDLACGVGVAAIIFAQKGYEVIGVDQSSAMLKLAQKRASKANLPITFLQQDMRKLNIAKQFDLITCMYDSLNYLLHYEELEEVFCRASKLLAKKGIFIFDVATPYALAVEWIKPLALNNNNKSFEIHQAKFDTRHQINVKKITCFVEKQENFYEKFIEIHQEKAYPLNKIDQALKKANLKILNKYSEDLKPLQKKSLRAVYVVQKSS